MRSPSSYLWRAGVLAFGLFASVTIGACGDDGDTADTTTAPTEATGTATMAPDTTAPATDDMGSDVESLSYLIQGLLTTEQIGGGWVDQGRQIIPPGSQQLTGFLCPDGETAVAALAGRVDPQVSASYRRSGDVGLMVYETLMWGARDQVTADFESLRSAVGSCTGAAYAAPDGTEMELVVDEPPAVGVAGISFHFAPTVPPTDTPWLESASTMVLLSEAGQPVAMLVGVGSTIVHDPATQDVAVLDPAEYARIVDVAVTRIVDQGL